MPMAYISAGVWLVALPANRISTSALSAFFFVG